MKIGKRLLLIGAVAALSLGTVAACGDESSAPGADTTSSAPATTEAPTTSGAAMPESATYIAEIPGPAWLDNSPIYLAINVKGENVAAFGSNDKDESAWFFGTQKDGAMELESDWLDKLTANFDGTNLAGTLVLNLPDAEPLGFTATPQSEPAGMYTATEGDARASWIVFGGSSYGVLNPYSQRTRRTLRQIMIGHSPLTQGFETQEKVRQHRINTQLQQAPQLAFGEWTTDMNGQPVQAVEVTADMKSLPDGS